MSDMRSDPNDIGYHPTGFVCHRCMAVVLVEENEPEHCPDCEYDGDPYEFEQISGEVDAAFVKAAINLLADIAGRQPTLPLRDFTKQAKKILGWPPK